MAAGKLNHLGNPVAADVKRLQPLEENDARALGGLRDGLFHAGQAFSDLFEERFGGASAAGLLADPQNIAPDVAEILRIEAKNFRALGKAREGGGEIVRRSGADVAQILGDDEVGSELFERLGVDGVKAFAAGNVFANEAIDFGRRSIVGDARVDDYFFGAS